MSPRRNPGDHGAERMREVDAAAPARRPDRPSAGELWLGTGDDRLSERALADLRRSEIGFVFQAFHLMDELTARRTSSCRAAGRRSPRGGPTARADLLDQVGRPTAPVTFPRPSRAASANGSQSPGRSSTTRSRAGGRADRQPGQCGDRRGAAPLRSAACRRADAGHRHPRRTSRRHRGPARARCATARSWTRPGSPAAAPRSFADLLRLED